MNLREIEKKFIVADKTLCQQQVDSILRALLKSQHPKEIEGDSSDYYYEPRCKATADFVRLRSFGDDTIELTVKKKDNSTNLNRLEINLDGGPEKNAKALCDAAFGPSTAKIKKRYTVFEAPAATVSTYVIEGINSVFVEVEAFSESNVHQTTEEIKKKLDLIDEPRSLYEMLVEPKLPVSMLALLMRGRHR